MGIAVVASKDFALVSIEWSIVLFGHSLSRPGFSS